MKQVRVKAYGKVNLGLDVTGRRPDGYHLVRMVMQTVPVCDELTVTVDQESSSPDPIRISCDWPEVPADSSNLAYKAAGLICRKYCPGAHVHIDICKHIPMAAGMAGGSADAAAVLRAMDECLELHMSQEEQDQFALQLGADVAFCLRRGTWLAEGIGEKLTRVTDLTHCFMVIIKPDFGVSTPWAYKELDAHLDVPGSQVEHPDIDGLLEALERNDIISIAGSMGNILETAVIETHPEIQKIKDSLVAYGAVKALMSGSGPTVFGIFNDAEKAEEAFSHIGRAEKYGKFKVEF